MVPPLHRYRSGIECCYACAAACDVLSAGEHGCDGENPFATFVDCADICRLTASILFRNSEAVEIVCGACTKACELTANRCANLDEDTFRACATACRACAEECYRIAHGWRGRKKEEVTGGPYAA